MSCPARAEGLVNMIYVYIYMCVCVCVCLPFKCVCVTSTLSCFHFSNTKKTLLLSWISRHSIPCLNQLTINSGIFISWLNLPNNNHSSLAFLTSSPKTRLNWTCSFKLTVVQWSAYIESFQEEWSTNTSCYLEICECMSVCNSQLIRWRQRLWMCLSMNWCMFVYMVVVLRISIYLSI